ncbi:MAG: RNase adapter RapZ [Bacteroidetes bacterium]|nr:RNase adapter RapZ [Bacteroidota bacterium]
MVTGLSGAGRSTALKALEDLDYEVMDNVPLILLWGLLDLNQRKTSLMHPLPLPGLLAVGIDVRTRDLDIAFLQDTLRALQGKADFDVDVLFLDADDDVLRRRFTETRRRHPIAGDLPMRDAIAAERQIIASLRDLSDLIIDTTHLAPTELRSMIRSRFRVLENQNLLLTVLSFGFRNGLPRESDMVFDVRFLKNPHYVPELRELTGHDRRVADYICADPGFYMFLDQTEQFLAAFLPRYEAEGRSYLTVSVGCTGGRHRSVAVANALAKRLVEREYKPMLRHRDIVSEVLCVPPSPYVEGERAE